MLEILLLGVLVVAIYLIAHVVTQQAERWRGEPLGVWRTVIFFCVFLGLLLVAMHVTPMLLGAGES
ncbi:MAG TPA: hypothetical protein PKZ76_15865 [Xanthomonadaceae bacterium]|nr:hypothetical protein [Xanthomonadaceae bacterium]